MLLGVTIVWGSTFPAVKHALEHISPAALVACRFSVASLAFAALRPRRVMTIPRTTWMEGGVLGLIMGLAYLAQTTGLQGTSAARSGFLTALYVLFTPPIQLLLGRGRPTLSSLAGVLVVFPGLYLLALPPGADAFSLAAGFSSGLSSGDLLTILCALLFAFYVVLMDVSSRRHESDALTFVQLFMTALLSLLLAPLLETTEIELSFGLASSLVYLGVFASLGAVWIQTRYQKLTTPTRASIIFSMEALFAALMAAWWLDDHLRFEEKAGGGLIVLGVLLSEIGRGTREETFPSEGPGGDIPPRMSGKDA